MPLWPCTMSASRRGVREAGLPALARQAREEHRFHESATTSRGEQVCENPSALGISALLTSGLLAPEQNHSAVVKTFETAVS